MIADSKKVTSILYWCLIITIRVACSHRFRYDELLLCAGNVVIVGAPGDM